VYEANEGAFCDSNEPRGNRNRHPLRDTRFSILWAGWAISICGDQFYLVALPWLVLRQTGLAIAMSTILMASAIPQAVLVLIGGAVTDRVSARKIMLVAASARALFVAGIGALACSHDLRVWELYLLGLFFGVADACSLPAGEKFLPSLVPARVWLRANSVIMSTAQFTETFAPATADIVTRTLGLAWAFFLDAISFLFVITRIAEAARSPISREDGGNKESRVRPSLPPLVGLPALAPLSASPPFPSPCLWIRPSTRCDRNRPRSVAMRLPDKSPPGSPTNPGMCWRRAASHPSTRVPSTRGETLSNWHCLPWPLR
jgi:MFS family permease